MRYPGLRFRYWLITRILIPLEGWRWRALLALAFLAFAVARLHADNVTPSYDAGMSYGFMGGGFAGALELVMDAGEVKPWWLRLAVDSVAAQVPTIAFQEAQGRTWEQVGNRMAWAEVGVLGVRIVKEW